MQKAEGRMQKQDDLLFAGLPGNGVFGGVGEIVSRVPCPGVPFVHDAASLLSPGRAPLPRGEMQKAGGRMQKEENVSQACKALAPPGLSRVWAHGLQMRLARRRQGRPGARKLFPRTPKGFGGTAFGVRADPTTIWVATG